MTKEIQRTEITADLSADFDRALDSLRAQFFDAYGFAPFGVPYASVESSGSGYLHPARTDVTDTGKAYRIVAEVPGIPKENLDIRVRGSSVEIRGESAKATEENGSAYVHRERTYAGYRRSFELPEPVVGSEAKARVENGILELELPKERPTPSPAEVKVPVP